MLALLMDRGTKTGRHHHMEQLENTKATRDVVAFRVDRWMFSERTT
jgi:hypothetical protein